MDSRYMNKILSHSGQNLILIKVEIQWQKCARKEKLSRTPERENFNMSITFRISAIPSG
jgi:hypothetical protein